MPKKETHVDQANHNKDFWISVVGSSNLYFDWVVIGMFYEAVHWIEAFLATKNMHSSSHRQRFQTMARLPETRGDLALIADYDFLRIDSENARYWGHKPTVSEIENLKPLIKRIRTTLTALL